MPWAGCIVTSSLPGRALTQSKAWGTFRNQNGVAGAQAGLLRAHLKGKFAGQHAKEFIEGMVNVQRRAEPRHVVGADKGGQVAVGVLAQHFELDGHLAHHDALVLARLAVGRGNAFGGAAGPGPGRGGQGGQRQGQQRQGAVQKQAAFHGRAG